MREALVAASSWGFAEMGLDRIEAQVHADNVPSLRLAEKPDCRR
jgi:ribosomal-protein-alanine N-acetyltransferase